MNEIITQIIGFLALALALLVFQVNKRRTMLQLQLYSCVLYVIHFFLLGAFTGAALNVVGGARSYVFDVYKNHKYARVFPAVFILLFSTAALITWEGYYSLLPVAASIGGTLAFWQNNPKTIRIISLISPPLWLAYNIVVGSYAGIINEVFLFGSTIVGIIRFDMSRKNPKRRIVTK
jgi:hypothetical protein